MVSTISVPWGLANHDKNRKCVFVSEGVPQIISVEKEGDPNGKVLMTRGFSAGKFCQSYMKFTEYSHDELILEV